MKVVVISLIILSLFGCVTTEEQRKETEQKHKQYKQQYQQYKIKIQSLNNQFDKFKSQVESEAHNGKITWVQVAIKLRDYDKQMAQNPERISDKSWKFDEDDREFHAYTLLLAEQLDNKKITYPKFNAMRAKRFNDIRKERTALEYGIKQKTQEETLKIQSMGYQKRQAEAAEESAYEASRAAKAANRSVTCHTTGSMTTCN